MSIHSINQEFNFRQVKFIVSERSFRINI